MEVKEKSSFGYVDHSKRLKKQHKPFILLSALFATTRCLNFVISTSWETEGGNQKDLVHTLCRASSPNGYIIMICCFYYIHD